MKWKLVPVEPTEAMIDAWNNDDSDEFRHAYTAMLAAAPKPEPLSDERIREIWIEHGLDDEDVEGFVRAIEREILGGGGE